jgi:hypothetical protein
MPSFEGACVSKGSGLVHLESLRDWQLNGAARRTAIRSGFGVAAAWFLVADTAAALVGRNGDDDLPPAPAASTTRPASGCW